MIPLKYCERDRTPGKEPPCESCPEARIGGGCPAFQWTECECDGAEGPCDAMVTRRVGCQTAYHYDAPERAKKAREEYEAEGTAEDRQQQLATELVALDAELEQGDPNKSPQLCAQCAATYNDYWEGMWRDYYSDKI